ncbi:MAG: hypothetical protein LBU41_02010, partial [Clostridiales Family XIII bacterium]|nr:hypothetical protein [Clostridiales Family XIII bacterium]
MLINQCLQGVDLRNDSILIADNSRDLFSSGSAQPQLPIKDMRKIKILRPKQDLLMEFAKIADGMLSGFAL